MTAEIRPLMMWRATVLTLFPEMFPGPLGVSLAGKALAVGPVGAGGARHPGFATDRHRSVDDTPAGGGPGMVLRADVLAAPSMRPIVAADRPRLLMSPRGRPLTQSRVVELAAGPGPLIVCGRFEGVDQRVIAGPRAGGGLDRRLCAVGRRNRRHGADRRLRPAAAGGDGQSWPPGPRRAFRTAYWNTRNIPARRSSRAAPIPEILTSGDHAKVAAWRQAEAEALTRARRPDLWAARQVRQGGQKRPKNTTDG